MSPQRPSQPLRHKPSMRVLVDRNPNTTQPTRKIASDSAKGSTQKLRENQTVSKLSNYKTDFVSDFKKSEVPPTREVSLKIAQKIKEVEQQHRNDQNIKKNDLITNKTNANGEAVKNILAFWKERDAAANTSVITSDASSSIYTAPSSRHVSASLTPNRKDDPEVSTGGREEVTPTAPPVPPSTPIQFLNLNLSKAWSPIVIPSLPRIFSRKTDRSSTPSINSNFDQESYHFGSEEDLGLDYQLSKPSFITEDILRNHYSITPVLDYHDYEDVLPASVGTNEVHGDDQTQPLGEVSCLSEQIGSKIPNGLVLDTQEAFKVGSRYDYDSASSCKDCRTDQTATSELLHDIYHSYLTTRINSVSPESLKLPRSRYGNDPKSATANPLVAHDIVHGPGKSTPVLPPVFPSDGTFTKMLDNVTPDHGHQEDRVGSSSPQNFSLADSSGNDSPVFLRFKSDKAISVQKGQTYQSSRALYDDGSPDTSSIMQRITTSEAHISLVRDDTPIKVLGICEKTGIPRDELRDSQTSLKQNSNEGTLFKPIETLDDKDQRRTTFHTTSFGSCNKSVSDSNQGRQVPLAKRTLRKIKSVFIETHMDEPKGLNENTLHQHNAISSFSVLHSRRSLDLSYGNPLSDLNQMMLPSCKIPDERPHKLSSRINAWRVSKLRRKEKPLLTVVKPKKPKDKRASLKTLVCLWRGKQVESTFSLFLSETTTSSPDQSPSRLQLATNGMSKMRNAMSLPRASKYFLTSPECRGTQKDTSFPSPESLQSAIITNTRSPAQTPRILGKGRESNPSRVSDTPTIRTVPVEIYEAELVRRRSPSEISAIAIWHGSIISDDESRPGSEHASNVTNIPNVEIANRFLNHADGSAF